MTNTQEGLQMDFWRIWINTLKIWHWPLNSGPGGGGENTECLIFTLNSWPAGDGSNNPPVSRWTLHFSTTELDLEGVTTLWLYNTTGALTWLRLCLIPDGVQLFLALRKQPIRMHEFLFITVLLCSVRHAVCQRGRRRRGNGTSLCQVALQQFPSWTRLPVSS